MSRLSTPILLALVAVLGLGNALTSAAVHADGDGELAPTVMPNALPPTAFLTGDERIGVTSIDGLDLHLERTADDRLAVVVHNPGDTPRTLSRHAEVVSTTGSMASRMGPIPMMVAQVAMELEVAPGQTMRKVFGGVQLKPLPKKEVAAEGDGEQPILLSPLMSFASLEVFLDGDALALIDPNPAVVSGQGAPGTPNFADLDVPQTASLNRRGGMPQARR